MTTESVKRVDDPVSRPSAAEIIAHYGLTPHPEGGHYARTYCSDLIVPEAVLPDRFHGDRAVGSAILYLLEGGDVSHWHRIAADEIWHFYLGDPLDLAIVSPGGEATVVRLGQDILAGEVVQQRVPAGCWFAAKPAFAEGYAFVGCSLSPAFDFEDFEMGRVDRLLTDFPGLSDLILSFSGVGDPVVAVRDGQVESSI